MVKQDRLFDTLLVMKDAGLVTTSAAAEVSSVAKVHDLGANANVSGDLIINMTAIEVDTSNEVCRVLLQGSNSASFASGIHVLCAAFFGDTVGVGGGADVDHGPWKAELPFRNRLGTLGPFRYLRVYHQIAGTIATGFNYTADLAIHHSY
jgi:hypothetical protein